MKFLRLENGTWNWKFRIRGLAGQAEGIALTRQEAIEQAMRRLRLMA